MRRYLTSGLERLTIQQLENVIADAEVLLKKRRDQESSAASEPLRPAGHHKPVVSYRSRPSARE